MAAVAINADKGTDKHAEILALLKRQKKMTPDEWRDRCRELMEKYGTSLWS